MTITFILLQTTTQSSQPTVTIWTVIAVIAALISAFSAFKSRGYARRAFNLAQQNYNDRQANFSLYLIDAFRWTTKTKPKQRYLLFHITIFNKSDSKSSFKAELEIEYLRNDNSVARAIIPHDEKHHKEIPQKDISAFSNDIRIEEKGMQSKWMIFEQPQNAFIDYRIEKYSVKVTDTQGNNQITGCSIIKELTND